MWNPNYETMRWRPTSISASPSLSSLICSRERFWFFGASAFFPHTPDQKILSRCSQCPYEQAGDRHHGRPMGRWRQGQARWHLGRTVWCYRPLCWRVQRRSECSPPPLVYRMCRIYNFISLHQNQDTRWSWMAKSLHSIWYLFQFNCRSLPHSPS